MSLSTRNPDSKWIEEFCTPYCLQCHHGHGQLCLYSVLACVLTDHDRANDMLVSQPPCDVWILERESYIASQGSWSLARSGY